VKAQPLAAFAGEQTRARLKRVISAVRFAAKHPQDPKTAHDLRVAIRRFLQCLRMFGGLFDPKPAEKLRARLRKLLDLCGAKRDYDVGLDVLAEAGLPPQHSVVLKFREQRDTASRALERHLGKKSTRASADRWRKQLRPAKDPGGEWIWQEGVVENARRKLPQLTTEFFREGDAAVAARGDYETLHQFRLGAKRLRYTLEVFLPAYGAGLKSKLPALRRLQDRMGAVNDCVVVLKLPGMDRAAATVVGRLLVAREAAFRGYWQETFSPRSRQAWMRVLGGSRPRTTPPQDVPPGSSEAQKARPRRGAKSG
jgi:CHAD domain-containing protein